VRTGGYGPLGRSWCRNFVVIPVLVMVPAAAAAQRRTSDAASGAASSSAATTTLPAGPSPKIQVQPKKPARWSRVHVPDPVGRRVASDALDLAAQKLTQAACANDLHTTFTDQSGRPLSVRLGELSLDVQTYLTMVVFIDASRETLCVRGAFAYTSPGNRVVGLCVNELKQTWSQNPEYAAARVIHEMLHTLGLGENPPTSDEITRRVMASCSPRK
jgi:hypothetical protein